MDRYSQLVTFVRAAENGGFSAAGRALSLSPSAVSKIISRLEERLGVLLFRRTHRALTLTPEGETFYAAALRAIYAIEETETSVYAGRASHDTLRIRCTPTFATAQLAPYLGYLHEANPSLRIEVILETEPGNPLDGGIDVAIYIGKLADSSLVAHRFSGTRWLVCASPDYITKHGAPATPDELPNHRCLNFIPIMMASHWTFGGLRQQASPIRIRSDIVSNQGEMLLALGMAGSGIVRLPEFHVHQALVAGRMVELFPAYQDKEEDPIYAIYQSRRHLSQRVRVFLEFLDRTFSNDPPLWRPPSIWKNDDPMPRAI